MLSLCMKLSLLDSIEHDMSDIKAIAAERPFLTDEELFFVMGGTPNSRYAKVKRLLAQGKLIHLRRGLYAFTEKSGCQTMVHPYALAPFIYGPAYVSLESALSYHGLIPEAVYTTTCVCTKRSKSFPTPLGIFTFMPVPAPSFYTEAMLIRDEAQPFLIAKPWRAICDYVYCYHKQWTTLDPLSDSLRIDLSTLPALRSEEAQILDEYYHRQAVSRFLKGVV